MATGDFDGFVAVVTGASSGLGRAIAEGAAARGAEAVVINYAHNKAEAEETQRRVEAHGAKAVIVQGDVADDADCKKIVAAAEPFGRIDALFNNAGQTTFAGHADMDAVSADNFARIYAVNVIGPFQMIRAARRLLEAGPQPGAVVNTASIAGVTGIGSSVPYAASKGALITMTLSLARALAPLIRVNAICPSYIDTTWFEKGRGAAAAAQVRENVKAKVPLKTATQAEDVAALVYFLATPQSRQITGELVRLDAGSHLAM